MQFVVTLPHPGCRVETALSHGTAELRLLLHLVVEQSSFSIGAFQPVFLEELRPQLDAVSGSRCQTVQNQKLSSGHIVVNWNLYCLDYLQPYHSLFVSCSFKLEEVAKTVMRNRLG